MNVYGERKLITNISHLSGLIWYFLNKKGHLWNVIEIFDKSQMKDTGNSNLMIRLRNNVTSGYLSEQLASVANILV